MPAEWLTDPATVAFIAIPIALVCWLLWTVPRPARPFTAIVAAAWMSLTWVLADAGVFRRWDATPPPFLLLPVGIVLLAVVMASGGYGRRLALGAPLWMLVAVQSFRLPLELAMHALAERSVMPPQMTYTGWNFDIVTGITALLVAAIAKRRPARALVLVWNIGGLALLINIVAIAIASTPRFQAFGPERLNTFVADVPFVWLPAVMVLAALAGHLLVFRALALQPRP